jgi:pimeloyl-ACP methyl ester carboxylesterase
MVFRRLVQQYRRLRLGKEAIGNSARSSEQLKWVAGRLASSCGLQFSHSPVLKADGDTPLPDDDAVWRFQRTSDVLLQSASAEEFESMSREVFAYNGFPSNVMLTSAFRTHGAATGVQRVEKGAALEAGDVILQTIPLLPFTRALSERVQTLAAVRVSAVIDSVNEKTPANEADEHTPGLARRGLTVCTTAEHEEIAEHHMWVEWAGEGSPVVLWNMGASRWADNIPPFLLPYTRRRYQHGHAQLRKHLLRRAWAVRASVAASHEQAGGGQRTNGTCRMRYERIPAAGGHQLELISCEPAPAPPVPSAALQEPGSPEREQKRWPPLLFLHGAGHSAHCWESTFLPFFAQRGVHAHAISVSGHGLSRVRGGRAAADGTVTLETWLEDLHSAVQHLANLHGIPPVVIGHSAGGGVAQVHAGRHEASVQGVALLASWPPAPPPAGLLCMLAGAAKLAGPLATGSAIVSGNSLQLVAAAEAFGSLMCSQQPQPPPSPDPPAGTGAVPVLPAPTAAAGGELPVGPSSDGCVLHHATCRRHHLELENFGSIDLARQLFMALRQPQNRVPDGLPVVVMGAEDDCMVPHAMTAHTAGLYNTDAVIVPATAHCLMSAAGGDWQRAAQDLHDELSARSLVQSGCG